MGKPFTQQAEEMAEKAIEQLRRNVAEDEAARTGPRTFWVAVNGVQPWSSIEVQGGLHSLRTGQPLPIPTDRLPGVGFLVIFADYAEALAWVDGDPAKLLELREGQR